MELGLVCPDIIVYFERNGEIQCDCFTAPVERCARVAGWGLDEWEEVGWLGVSDKGGV